MSLHKNSMLSVIRSNYGDCILLYWLNDFIAIRQYVLIPLFLIILLIGIVPGFADDNINPISPPDTSSPRAIIRSFNEIMNETVNIHFEDEDPDSTHSDSRILIQKASKCFDMSQVKPVNAKSVAIETPLLIYDVLNRIELPPYEDIPDAAKMKEDGLTSWTVPGTEITVALVEEGSQMGKYLFTASTVEHAAEFYELTRYLPNKTGIVERDVYEIYEMYTGTMVPRQLIDVLPDWMKVSLFGQMIWKWIGFMSLSLIYVLCVFLMYRWEKMKKWDVSKRSFFRRLIFLFMLYIQ